MFKSLKPFAVLNRASLMKGLCTATLLSLTGLALAPSPALAWKPTTHVYLANQAIEDAVDNGKVTISKINPQTGEIIGEIGEYTVSPALLSALQNQREQYTAGVLGPDAYPDILTGQQVIHPGPDDTGIAGGTNAWLQYLWQQAQGGTPEENAFVAGYITHAAGDMYAHTFINNFSGGPFAIEPPAGPANAVKHVVLEGYMDKRLDAIALGGNFFQASIDGVENFIYRTMVDAKPGTELSDRLLVEGAGGTSFSVPRIYSTMRTNLQSEIDSYYAAKADYDTRYQAEINAGNNCGVFDFSCSRTASYARAAAIQTAKATFVTTNGLQTTYKEAWREDIDDGLQAWPQVSHQVATALFFNPSRSTNVAAAQTILEDYATDHLLSMSGAPDFVGLSIGVVGDIVDAITPDFLLEPIRQLKEDLLNTLLKEAIGMDKDELAKYLKNPELYFDDVMSSGAGEQVSLAEFNQNYLKISDGGYSQPNESFDYRQVPAAYNTVAISKLIMLPPAEINRLLADLGSTEQLASPNVMLGFIQSLDADNQWHDNPDMVLAGDYCAYSQVFMSQPGERGTPSISGCPQVAAVPDDDPAVEPESPDQSTLRNADCLAYDPSSLSIQDEGASGWLLTDGRSRMLVLDNEQDANAAIALAQQHTQHCFIGRNNQRDNRASYIVEYWQGESGLETTVSPQDCIPYNRSALTIRDEGASGWLLTDSRSRMLVLDNEQDAEDALSLAQSHNSQCFIGRGNRRDNRRQYIVNYWQ